MFARFNDQSRRCVVLAQENSRLLGASYIGTEHILLGLLWGKEGEDRSLAGDILATCGVFYQEIFDSLRSSVGESGSVSNPQRLTTNTKRVMEAANQEAVSLGSPEVGTEHILLGLVRNEDSTGTKTLSGRGVSPTMVRAATAPYLGSVAESSSPN